MPSDHLSDVNFKGALTVDGKEVVHAGNASSYLGGSSGDKPYAQLVRTTGYTVPAGFSNIPYDENALSDGIELNGSGGIIFSRAGVYNF